MFFSLGLTAACAGNPPQWWNPSGAYGNEASAVSHSAGSTPPSAPPAPVQEMPVVQEENIASFIPDDSYEEMILTPMQDEETEEPAGGEDASSNTMDITPSAPDASSELPVPSVLMD